MSRRPARRPAPVTALAGAALIRSLVPTLPNEPGVYRMLDERGEPLYVGKAKTLKKRVPAYAKTQGAVGAAAAHGGADPVDGVRHHRQRGRGAAARGQHDQALRPTFNIVLRDDKSFPYILLRTGHEFPLIGKHRGAKRPGTEYFGPFASAGAVNDTLNALLKAFPLRSCRDSIFTTRTRPCLQYQIKRCSAPCVGRIGAEAYGRIVDEVRGFLCGRSGEVQTRLQAGDAGGQPELDFERAAMLRDRLKAMAHIQARQGINTEAVDDADVIAGAPEGGQVCVQVFSTAAAAITAIGPTTRRIRKDPRRRDPGGLPRPVLCRAGAAAPGAAGRAGAGAGAAGRGAGGEGRRKVELVVPSAARSASWSRSRRPMPARRWPGGWRTPRARRRCWSSWPSASTCPRCRRGSRSTTTATSRAAMRSAPSSSPGRTASTSAVPHLQHQGRRAGAGDDYAMMREVLQRRFGRLIKEDPERAGEGWPEL